MITPQQFLESFLQEKTGAWAEARPHLKTVFNRYFGEQLLQHAEYFMPRDNRCTFIEDVILSEGVASAVVREHFRSADIRTRYRIAASGETWGIIGIDRVCVICQGTGQSNDARCQQCGGEGWVEPNRDAD
jgi:hypothetical protein